MKEGNFIKLLETQDDRTTVGVRRCILDAFNEALNGMEKGGKAVERLIIRYLEATDFERMVMLHPEIPFDEIMRKIAREEFAPLVRDLVDERLVDYTVGNPQKESEDSKKTARKSAG